MRINSAGVVLSQADFAMSKISVNEEYHGNDIRKAIDYFCHFAKTPSDYDNIKQNDVSFSQKDIFNKITWIKDKADNLYGKDTISRALGLVETFKELEGYCPRLSAILTAYHHVP